MMTITELLNDAFGVAELSDATGRFLIDLVSWLPCIAFLVLSVLYYKIRRRH